MGQAAKPQTNECQSCMADRKKQGLPPVVVVRLPLAVTNTTTFKKKKEVTVLCPYCDGETLVSSALKAHKSRQVK